MCIIFFKGKYSFDKSVFSPHIVFTNLDKMAPQIWENRPFFARNSAILQETELTSLNLKIDHDTALLGRDKTNYQSKTGILED